MRSNASIATAAYDKKNDKNAIKKNNHKSKIIIIVKSKNK